MREFCTEKVNPAVAQSVVEIMESFGWECIDSEEFYDENTHVTGVEVNAYGDGLVGGFMKGWTGKDGEVKVNTYTTVTNYVTLRFMRDTEIPHYNRLRELQEDFMGYLGDMILPDKPKKITAVAIVVAIISVLAVTSLIQAIGWLAVLIPIVVNVGCILTIIFSWKNYKRKEQYYYYVYNKAESILQEAIELQS